MTSCLIADAILPDKNKYIVIGPCQFTPGAVGNGAVWNGNVSNTTSNPLTISGTSGISILSGSGTVDFEGATLTNVHGLSSDPDVFQVVSNYVTTIGNVGATLASYNTDTNVVYDIKIRTIGKVIATNAYYVFDFHYIVVNNGGTVSITPIVNNANYAAPPTTLACTFVSSGTTMNVNVVGETGLTVKWKTVMDIFQNV